MSKHSANCPLSQHEIQSNVTTYCAVTKSKNRPSISINDLHVECQNHMAQNGLSPDGPIVANGKIHRYSIDSNKTKKDEWHISWEGISAKGNAYLGCIYGSWSDSSQHAFKSWENAQFASRFDDEERKALHRSHKERMIEVERLLAEEREQAAKKAKDIWESASQEPSNENHLRYTHKKGISPVGARFTQNPAGYDAIVIPLQNIDGEIRSLQFISVADNGKVYKGFLPKGEKKGNFFTIDQITDTEPLYVVEGYATGVSVHQATKAAVIVAFDSGSLSSVIQNLRGKYPKNEIIIAADSDEVGKSKANNAAKLFGCGVVFSEFPPDKELDEKGDKFSDFNDLQSICGIDEVRNQIQNATPISFIIEETKSFACDLMKSEEPCEAFSTSVLPKCLHEYISSIAEVTNADPIMIATSVLCTISSFVKKKIFLPEGEYFQTLYPNLWMLSIMKSGQFKTTGINKGAALAWKKSDEIHKEIKIIGEKIRSAEKKESEDLSAERLFRSIENPMLPGKITSEALMEHLSQGHGGMILTSEFGAWLQNLEKSHNSDLKQIFTDIFDVPPFFRYKTKTSGDHLIEKPFVSICAVSTPAWIKENLNPNDVTSGFFARFLLFTPPHNDEIPPALPHKGKKYNVNAKKEIEETIGNMDGFYEYRFTDGSRSYFCELHNSIYDIPKKYSEKCQEILDPYLKRWSPYLLKLAMIFRLFEDPISKELSESSLASAMEIVDVAIKSTAKLFEGELGESEQQRKFRLVFEWVCKRTEKGKSTRYKDIITSKVLEGGGAEYDYALEHLVNAEKLRKIGEHPKKEVLYLVDNKMVEKVEKG